jgi:large subunit ribosomal protein L23
MKDPRDIILAPVVSEKSYALMEAGVYTFKVHPSASRRSGTPSRRSGTSR